MLLEGRGHAVGPGEGRQVHAGGVAALGVLDAALDLAHRVEIVAELAAVAGPEARPQPAGVLAHEVEQAPVLPRAHRPHRGVGGVAIAEQPLEHAARVGLVGQRGRGRAPRDGVAVGAAVAGIAAPDHPHVLQPQLERRQRRRAADILGQHLVDGHAVPDVRPLRLLRVDAGQPARARAGVVAGPVPERLAVAVGQSGQHQEPIAKRLERVQRLRERESGAGLGRGPVAHDHAVGGIDERHPGDGSERGRERGGHRIEEREGDRRSQASQEGPTRQGSGP